MRQDDHNPCHPTKENPEMDTHPVNRWFDANPVDHLALEQARQERTAELVKADPDLPYLTAVIIAGDQLSADRSTRMVADGVPVRQAMTLVGSYARMGWLLDMHDAGHLTDADLLELMPVQWPACDPDDTEPRFLWAWRKVWALNGRRTILDDPDQPLPGVGRLTIYRGQGEHQVVGIAWSLSEKVAHRFARGASVRVPGGVPHPVVYRATVARSDVLAYLTGRNEQELIVSPGSVR